MILIPAFLLFSEGPQQGKRSILEVFPLTIGCAEDYAFGIERQYGQYLIHDEQYQSPKFILVVDAH